MLKQVYLSTALAVSLALSACSDDSDYDFNASQTQAQNNYSPSLAPLFDPAKRVLPSITNDLMFADSTDGTLNIPTASASASQKALLDMINTLDGFGLTAPISIAFASALKTDTVKLGSTLHVFEVKKTGAAVTSIVREIPATEMVATVTSSGKDIALVPLKPLKESTSYMVVLTNDIKDTNGKNASTPSAYLLAKSSQAITGENADLEPIRQMVNAQEAAALTQGIAKNRIIMSWSFTTQSVTPILSAATAQAKASNILISPTAVGTTKLISDKLQGKANIHVGVLDLPYYLDAKNIDTGYWKGASGSLLSRLNPTPVANSTQTVPVMMSIPNATSAAGAVAPVNGWPIVIYQHGITSNRLSMVALADALADAGFAMIAIDLPLHGVTDTTNPLYAANFERTFNVDTLNNTTSASGKDGKIDDSGAHFINLKSVLTSRDNIRQGISDLTVLRKSLGNIAAVKIDTSRVGFIGISLGAIVGTGYLSQEATPTASTLSVPGGGIARLLDGSATFGPIIRKGLAEAGLQAGTADYDTFMAVTQMIVDPADPIVLVTTNAAATHPIHLTEVVGVNGMNSDKVIPNRVAGAPLSGTEPLISMMGLKKVTATSAGSGAVRFSAGEHASLLRPDESLATTVEMQRQSVIFQANRGAAIVVTDPSVISTQ